MCVSRPQSKQSFDIPSDDDSKSIPHGQEVQTPRQAPDLVPQTPSFPAAALLGLRRSPRDALGVVFVARMGYMSRAR